MSGNNYWRCIDGMQLNDGMPANKRQSSTEATQNRFSATDGVGWDNNVCFIIKLLRIEPDSIKSVFAAR